jgi:hypothetical protein
MPLLRHILSNANDKSHALLRAKALECISLVGMAVGREQFRQDAHRVMQFMQSLQVGPSDEMYHIVVSLSVLRCPCSVLGFSAPGV